MRLQAVPDPIRLPQFNATGGTAARPRRDPFGPGGGWLQIARLSQVVTGPQGTTMKPEQKTELVSQYRKHEKDTGSPEIQVALLTSRITELTEHLKTHRKDFASRRGLLKLVGRRTSLLRYLNAKDGARYRAVIQRLGLRK